MAEGKSRPSKKEMRAAKREEARRARIEAQRKAARRKKIRNYSILAVVVIIVGVGGFFALQQRGLDASAVAEARQEAGCGDIEEHPDEGAGHVEAPTEITYESNPPSSGDHRGTTARWGWYRERVEDAILVHNLEHGGVVIHYRPGDLAESEVAELEELVDSYPDPGSGSGVILNPNPDAPEAIAMAAWTHTQTCESYRELAVQGFIDERCGNGPERFSLGCA